MKCNCGSGQDSWWRHDARGIPLCRVCEECEQEKISKYRQDILTDTNYWADEQIESED